MKERKSSPQWSWNAYSILRLGTVLWNRARNMSKFWQGERIKHALDAQSAKIITRLLHKAQWVAQVTIWCSKSNATWKWSSPTSHLELRYQISCANSSIAQSILQKLLARARRGSEWARRGAESFCSAFARRPPKTSVKFEFYVENYPENHSYMVVFAHKLPNSIFQPWAVEFVWAVTLD